MADADGFDFIFPLDNLNCDQICLLFPNVCIDDLLFQFLYASVLTTNWKLDANVMFGVHVLYIRTYILANMISASDVRRSHRMFD